MPRLPHGKVITFERLQAARDAVAESSTTSTLGFAAARPADTQDFGFLFPALQRDPESLLPESRETRDDLIRL
ncbi:MAG: hypothetical protein ACRDTR_00045, partial [Rubrobacter sp.]